MKRQAHVPLSAALLVLTASACFTVIDVSAKFLSQRYPIPLLVWARWSVQALLMLALIGPRLRWKLLRTERLGFQVMRGAVLIASSVCFFSALKYLPLAEATALNYTSPVLVTLMAGWLLGERLTPQRWFFVITGMAGMLLIVRPGSAVLTPAALFALGAAALYATFQILTRKLAGEDVMVLMMYPTLVGAVVLSVPVPFLDDRTWYPIRDIVLFVGVGIMGFVGHLLFTHAFRRASASAIAPFTYMQLVWSTLAGWLVFGSFPDPWALCGIVVIAGSGVVLTWYERRKPSVPQAEPAAVD